MLNGLTGWHFLIVLVVVLLLFGATKLPALAKGLGESMRIFKSEIKKSDAAPTSTPTESRLSEPDSAAGNTVTGASDNPDAPHTSPKP